MLITFLQTRRLSEDTFIVKRFYKDGTYDVADTAARSAIKYGWAVSAEPPKTMEQVVDEMLIRLAKVRAGRAA